MGNDNFKKYMKLYTAILYALVLLCLLIWPNDVISWISGVKVTPSAWLFRLEILLVILAVLSRQDRVQEVIQIWRIWREGTSILRYSIGSIAIAFLILLVLASNIVPNTISSASINSILPALFFLFATTGLTLWIIVNFVESFGEPDLLRNPYSYIENIIKRLKQDNVSTLYITDIPLNLLSLTLKPENESTEILVGKLKELSDEERKRNEKPKWIVLRLEIGILKGNIQNITRYEIEDYRKL